MTEPDDARRRGAPTRLRLPDVALTPGVPRKIHHIFFGGLDHVAPEARENVDRIRAINPDWEHVFFDKARADRFIKYHFGEEIFYLYDSIDPLYYAARADMLRYMVCYVEGGVYLDIKSAADRPLDSVLREDDVFLLSQWAERRHLPGDRIRNPLLRGIDGGAYVQWFIVSAPGHPFLRAVIERCLANLEGYSVFRDGVGRDGVFRLTGPTAYTLAIHPIRARHPHRYVDYDDDLGLRYSIFDDFAQHRKALGHHYSDTDRPIVRTGWATALAATGWRRLAAPILRGVRLRRP